MMYLARKGLTDFQVIPEPGDGATAAEQIPQLVRLINRGYTIYSVNPQGGGNFLLLKQRARPGTVVTEQRVVSLEVEDDV